ncbi:MAG: DsbA family protein [Rhodospirillaceae bacterium]|nr:DsbA family protein [Rhodospirillaceae bacterium]
MHVGSLTTALAVAASLAFGIAAASAQDAAKPAAAPAAAANTPQYREYVIGDAKAPVTIIEYASLTCSHCAHFHQTAYQDIKKNYIETGKVRFVFRDYPLDGLAMAGAVLARCAPGDRGIKMIEMMFKNQDTWVRAEKPIEPLKGYAQLAGMSAADVEACLKNEQILTAVREVQNTATNLYKIQSTPTFFVDDEKVEGGRDYAYMAKLIDEKLAKKK